MAKITFVQDEKIVDVKPGEKLIDVCRKENLSIAFGCEVGACGTCLSRITKGAQNLSKPTTEEQEMLGLFSQQQHERLICQCSLVKDDDVEIE